MLANIRLQQILNAIRHDRALFLPFFRRWIPPFQSCGEDLLCRYASLVESDPSIWTDRIFAQL